MYWIKIEILPHIGYYLWGREGLGGCYNGRMRFTSKEAAEIFINRFYGLDKKKYKIIECKDEMQMKLERCFKSIGIILVILLILFLKFR